MRSIDSVSWLGTLTLALMTYAHAQYVITCVSRARTSRGYQNCVLFNRIFVISMFVLSGISLYSLYGGHAGTTSLYGSHAGTTSERSLYPEIRTNHVCYSETPL